MENIALQILIATVIIILSISIPVIILPNPNTAKYMPHPPHLYQAGDYIAVRRNGSNEVISGRIKEIYKDIIWEYDIAVVETDKGERIITSETDTFRNGY